MQGARASALEAIIKQVHALAEALGVARTWWDVDGAEQTVADEALMAICAALGFPASSEADILASVEQLARERRRPPAMIVTEAGSPTPLPASLARAEIVAEDGTARVLDVAGWTLPPIAEPGYYRLTLGGHELTLAVAPPACPTLPALAERRLWGPAIQIPALRGREPQPFGHLGHLHEAVELFAARGADAVAINPVHALFPGDGLGFSPYSPSSRIYFNGAMGDPALLGLPPLPPREGGAFIDWEGALPHRLADLRAVFAGLDKHVRARIARDNAGEGEGLRRQAIFDALDTRLRAKGARSWRDWPKKYRDPQGKAVRRFAEEEAEEVEFHLFVQWLAREGLGKVQASARALGMGIGLLADLAVGVHTGGSDAWTMRDVMLEGLTIGAPPDPLGPQGQNWALTSFSPRGLAASGYAPWIRTLRAALTRAGGLRIDHAFGLSRLWVVPSGGQSSDGAYLDYPFQDLLRLVALEAHRANALIVAEDLGTMPHGFGEAIAANHMLGMRVLWFERAADEGFIGPQDYAPQSVAMTGTHDTATVAGWWTGRDLDWADRLDRFPADATRAQEESRREWDRGLLWSTIGDGAPRPAPEEPAPVVEAALRHIGRARSRLAIAPLEDLLALEEQPNLPGTTTEHPNWRRRLDAPLDELLDAPETARRIDTLAAARRD
ncbi:4-alpha-glucanotransferase [Novosphingobium album (ex Liu et al. 2023)]|uniref:4-alpha-glucanotransferase n=1 Tax=Novosphingobium album (ex Liu et al. 2023) TaxID=3031130 RepID=A0ABT5WNG0_9SPHN|nr:4-alpha-glucanotransferase [Novosphingobium album (ex Liu et al. 2023)]MDE8651266.1 4-alpha-glucanotransferase [Novosphingobium album (ex Liu et al. 2023)]